MAGRRYTDEQLEAAKEFLRQRLEGEISMENDVFDLLSAFAERLIELYLNGAGQEQIDALVEDLVAMLLDDCQTLAVDEHTDKRDLIIPYIMREWKGDNLEGRIRNRARTFLVEATAVYVAGTILGKAKNAIVQNIKASMKEPWQNPLLVEVRQKIKEGDMAVLGRMGEYGVENPAIFDEAHYGKGVPISSLVDLQRMTRYAVGEGWMYYGWLDAREKGAVGYYVERGSSYNCDICDSHVGTFYYINDESNRPQYHLNCCCYIVYVYKERI